MGALIGGIIGVILGLWGIIHWIHPFAKVLEGAVPFLVLIIGIIAIAAGISDIKDKIEEKKEKEQQTNKEEEKKE
jgi:uncharacterized membrane protein HdeD (DUF308 family)